MKTIFIMEDHPIVSESLASFFNDTGRWNVLGTSSSLAEAKEKIPLLKNIDVLLMDILLPDGWGIDIVNWLKKQNYKLPLLAVYTAFDDYSYVSSALNLGVMVYMIKLRNKEKLENAIINAFDGIVCIDEDAQRKINKITSLTDTLTNRESEILINVKKGLTNEEIAVNLSISPRTVSNIISCILDKTGIKSRRALEKI
ncbi:MAG: response regulator transcription factor [Treponema sp.]|nr:response regulator transcription factor [Treponema sp.]MCL2251489.1 response regulator transcription factor [Treponema sp.]